MPLRKVENKNESGMARKVKLESRKDILEALKKIEQEQGKIKLQSKKAKILADSELKKKEKQLLRSKEKYYAHAREYIELWVKSKKTQRGA